MKSLQGNTAVIIDVLTTLLNIQKAAQTFCMPNKAGIKADVADNRVK